MHLISQRTRTMRSRPTCIHSANGRGAQYCSQVGAERGQSEGGVGALNRGSAAGCPENGSAAAKKPGRQAVEGKGWELSLLLGGDQL